VLNFSAVPRDRLIGRLLRLPLKILPRSAVVRIIQGRLKGLRWVLGAGTHGCWIGSYELHKQQRFAAELKEGQVVYDIGANVGFYSLLAAKCVGSTGRVFAFEPLPENLSYLRRHVALNGLANATVCPVAVSDVAGVLHFTPGKNRSTGHLDVAGDLEVKALSLDDFVIVEKNPHPQIIKIDVEGAEVRVLRGAQRVLETHRPLIFLATHGVTVHRECCQLLRAIGYRLQSIDGEAVEDTDELMCLPPIL
jgi:FkbM family methyltransferase